jgi:predicted DCC family thiol-disulfide oxidoreductase YuxK
MKMKKLPPFEVFFDGDCPLCTKEIGFIRKLDQSGSLIFTDISALSFNSIETTGQSFDTLMTEIHGKLNDGRLVSGVEVFRQLYSRTFFSFLVPSTRIWGMRHFLHWAYCLFAKNRLRFTGRCKDKSCSIPIST